MGPRGPAVLLPAVVVMAVGSTLAGAMGGRRGGRDRVSGQELREVAGDDNPVTQVVQLLEKMKRQVESEAKEDDKVYSKMACWCKTNDGEKTAAIKTATARIDELSAAIEEGGARAAKLTSEISGLNGDIQDNKGAISKAAALREQETAEFEAEEKDLKESLAALGEAVAILSKVQLLQQGPPGRLRAAGDTSLVQVREIAAGVTRAAVRLDLLSVAGGGVARYGSVMQKDLWDLLGAMPGSSAAAAAPLARRAAAELAQQEPTGHAAGAKSYNARSGSVLGMLEEMEARFTENLAQAQKSELEAEISFQRLRAATQGEIQAAGLAVEEKGAGLADTGQKVAQAKEDIEDTRGALSADERFLMDLKERCAAADSEYAARSKTRQDETVAIAEAIKILLEDDARDLFSKTMSLLQLDGFEKVKELMDKMLVELKSQQQEEYEKHETCKKDIGANEGQTRTKRSEEKDLQAQLAGLEGAIAALAKEIEDLESQVADARVSLKRASEDRQAEGREFQQTVTDQRSTAAILTKALERLRAFYDDQPGAAALLALRTAGAASSSRGRGGQPAAPAPPPAGKAYEESGMAAGVLQMLEKVIQDARQADREAVLAEQASQRAYAELVADINAELDASTTAITERKVTKGKADADRLIAKKDAQAVGAALEGLSAQSRAYHLQCDYLLQNFNARQTARQEEVEAIREAKAILSGADFGL